MNEEIPKYPETLPDCVNSDDYSEDIGKNYVESQNDTGPIKRRVRTTTSVNTYNVSIFMTAEQVELFKDFVFYTIGRVKPFLFKHPRTQEYMPTKIKDSIHFKSVGGTHFIVSFIAEYQA